MPSALEDAAGEFRAALLAQERAAASEMVRAYGASWQRVRVQLDGLQLAMRAAQDGGADATALLYQQRRLLSLERQIAIEMRDFAALAGDLTEAGQLQAVQAAISNSAALIQTAQQAAGLPLVFDRLPVEAVQEFLGFASNGSPLRALFDALGDDVSRGIRDELAAAIATGRNPRETAREIRRLYSMGMQRALVIARTEQIRAYREATHQTYLRNADVLDGWIWLSAANRRTCAACVVGETVVSSPAIEKVFSRHYTGDIIVIETAEGKHLTVTPNHPILTSRGWVAAGLLHEGDYVVSSADSNGAALGVSVDNYHMPTIISEVAETFGVVLAEMECAPPDFHGDGIGSDVYVVRSGSLLGDDWNAVFSEYFKQRQFGFGCSVSQPAGGLFFPRQCGVNSFLPRNLIGFGNVFDGNGAISQRDFGTSQFHILGIGSAFDVLSAQASSDATSCNVESLSQIQFAFASNVSGGDFGVGQSKQVVPQGAVFLSGNNIPLWLTAQQSSFAQDGSKPLSTDAEAARGFLRRFARDIRLDCVLKISVRCFSGHVYNLQTQEGWYSANGIITHNCWAMHGTFHPLKERLDDHPSGRCVAVPVVKGHRPTTKDGEELFRLLPEAGQRAVLGAGAWAAWKAGAVRLSQFAGQRSDPEWGTMRYRRSLREILGRTEALRWIRQAQKK